MHTPAISVLIPAYNMARYLPSAIESVIQDSFKDVEVIVVDDGSTDDTIERVAAFTDPGNPRFDARVRSFHKENGGKSTAINLAFAKMRGAYALVLDADDELAPGALSALYGAAASAGEETLAIGGFETFSGNQHFGTRPAPTPGTPSKLRKQFFLSPITPFHLNACLIPRALVERTGGFDPDLRRCVDGDFAIRLLEHARHIEPVNRTVYRYRKYRWSARERLRFRLRTACDRQRVIWKNFHGPFRARALAWAGVLSVAKILYEVFAFYKK